MIYINIYYTNVFSNNFSVFTTMLGHKSSVNPVKNLIRNVKAKQIAQTRFCQGRTMRWAIAWTFEDHPLYKGCLNIKINLNI